MGSPGRMPPAPVYTFPGELPLDQFDHLGMGECKRLAWTRSWPAALCEARLDTHVSKSRKSLCLCEAEPPQYRCRAASSWETLANVMLSVLSEEGTRAFIHLHLARTNTPNLAQQQFSKPCLHLHHTHTHTHTRIRARHRHATFLAAKAVCRPWCGTEKVTLPELERADWSRALNGGGSSIETQTSAASRLLRVCCPLRGSHCMARLVHLPVEPVLGFLAVGTTVAVFIYSAQTACRWIGTFVRQTKSNIWSSRAQSDLGGDRRERQHLRL